MMKYLIPALQARPGSVNLTEQEFRQLLADTQVGKPNRTLEDFTESMERIINELRASASAEPFLRPVSRKIAPDYEAIITHPMDLSTLLKNVKSGKYRNKSVFAKELNLIWTNCLTYNSLEGHPIRAQAQLMKQKADHHLEFLVEPEDRTNKAPVDEPSTTVQGEQQVAIKAADSSGIIEEDSYLPRNCSLLGVPAVQPSLAEFEQVHAQELTEQMRRRQLLESEPLLRPSDVKQRRLPRIFAATTGPEDLNLTDKRLPKRDRRSSKTARADSSAARMTNNLNVLLDMRQHHAQLSNQEILTDHQLRLSQQKEDRTLKAREVTTAGASVQLEEVVCSILAHTGIEGASASCVRSLVTVGQDYLSRLGRTIKLSVDRVGKDMTPEEIVLHTIHESGDTGVKELERYLREDIDRLGQKLRDAERRLRQAIQEQPEEDDALEDDSMDEAGLLLNQIPGLEDDAMGFLGFSMPSIPRHLLLGKSRKSKTEQGPSTPAVPEEEHPAPPSLLPLLADEIPLQIGLLRDFYQQRAQGQTVVKDEPFDPNTSTMTNMGIAVQPKQPSAVIKRKGAAALSTEEEVGGKKAKKAQPSL